MNNKKRKGFTLVELLVVIAIIAILAGASIVGYLGFTAKAKQSNAVNELAQYKTYLIAELADGIIEEEETTGDCVLTIVENTKIKSTATNTVTATAIEGIVGAKAGTLTVTYNPDKIIETITLTKDEVTATWTIASGEVK